MTPNTPHTSQGVTSIAAPGILDTILSKGGVKDLANIPPLAIAAHKGADDTRYEGGGHQRAPLLLVALAEHNLLNPDTYGLLDTIHERKCH